MSRPLFLVLTGLLLVACTTTPAGITINNVSIVDVSTGDVIEKQSVQINGSRIQAVGPIKDIRNPQAAMVVDATGLYLIPGLWDMHVHPDGKRDLDLLIANGVLGARIMYGEPEHIAWRKAIDAGHLLGPRLLISGPIIEGPPPESVADLTAAAEMNLIATDAAAREEVRQQHAAGFDYLKVYNNLPLPAYEALADEGRKLGMPVVGHVPFAVGIENALDLGQASVEHMRGYVHELVPADASVVPGPDLRSRILAWRFADMERADAWIHKTLESRTYHCPTFSFELFFMADVDVARYLDSEEAAWLSDDAVALLSDRSVLPWLRNFSAEDFAAASSAFRVQKALLYRMHEAGVPILAGTDAPLLGFTLHDELAHLVDAGLSETEALQAATINATAFAGLGNSYGRVLPGHTANLVLLRGNPLESITNSREIEAVVLDGHYLDRDALDSILMKRRRPEQR